MSWHARNALQRRAAARAAIMRSKSKPDQASIESGKVTYWVGIFNGWETVDPNLMRVVHGSGEEIRYVPTHYHVKNSSGTLTPGVTPVRVVQHGGVIWVEGVVVGNSLLAPPSGPSGDASDFTPGSGSVSPQAPNYGKSQVFGDAFATISTATWSYLSGLYPSPGTKGQPSWEQLDFIKSSQNTASGGCVQTAAYDASNTTTTVQMGTVNAWDTGLLTTGTAWSSGGGNNFTVQANDFLAAQVTLPTAAGAWPYLFTWYPSGTDNNQVQIEYHPDNANTLYFTNFVPSNNPQETYSSGSISAGATVWIGMLLQAGNVIYYLGTGADVTTMVPVAQDNAGVGTSYQAYIGFRLSVSDGVYWAAPSSHTSFSWTVKQIQVWR